MMNKSLTSHTHLHFVVYDDENTRVRIQSARTEQRNPAVSAMTHLNASDWPLHSSTQQNRVWLVINAQHCKNAEKEI